MGEPRETLKKYYLDRFGEIRGRKFYWHHTNQLENKKNYQNYENIIKDRAKPTTTTVHFLKPLKTFSFKVEFKNLQILSWEC